jgi:hypothetical protein
MKNNNIATRRVHDLRHGNFRTVAIATPLQFSMALVMPAMNLPTPMEQAESRAMNLSQKGTK